MEASRARWVKKGTSEGAPFPTMAHRSLPGTVTLEGQFTTPEGGE